MGIADVQGDIQKYLPGSAGSLALFLDLDDTLIDIAPTPDAVLIPSELAAILNNIQKTLGKAMAIVSGQPLDDIDRLLAPIVVNATAEIHSGEIRMPLGEVKRVPAPAYMPQLRTRVFDHMARIPGILIEDKETSIAVH